MEFKNLPKIVFTDIDGVWTDGGMYYDNKGNEFKKFNTSDSAVILFCKKLNIPLIILTGEKTKIINYRAKKLHIKHVYKGVRNKLGLAQKICKKYNVLLSECAYIGDDIIDIPLLESVGFSGAPENAIDSVKSIVNYVTKKKGGEGAFREFIENIVSISFFEDIIKGF